MRHRKKKKSSVARAASGKATTTNLIVALFLYEKISTTKERAKTIKPEAEKLITLCKKRSVASKQRLHAALRNKNAEKKLREVISKKYKDRQGGYTRITSLGLRKGDRAELVQIELV